MKLKESKYKVSDLDTGMAYWAFDHWLSKNAPKEAALAYNAIEIAAIVKRDFENYPANLLTLQQKKFITYVKKEFQKAVAWLKAEGEL